MLPHMGPTVTVHKHEMTHPCARVEPPRSLGEQYQHTTAPDPTLTSPLLPCPHILILFGLSCQATVSINTAPGNSYRKPPWLCGKLDAITVRTPICSDNWMSVRTSSFSVSTLLFFLQKTKQKATCLVIVYIFCHWSNYPNNPQPNLRWSTNSQRRLLFPLITISSLSPINSPFDLHDRGGQESAIAEPPCCLLCPINFLLLLAAELKAQY